MSRTPYTLPASCARKDAFPTREEAMRRLESLRYAVRNGYSTRRQRQGKLSVYRCNVCGLFHVGHIKLERKRQFTRGKHE